MTKKTCSFLFQWMIRIILSRIRLAGIPTEMLLSAILKHFTNKELDQCLEVPVLEIWAVLLVVFVVLFLHFWTCCVRQIIRQRNCAAASKEACIRVACQSERPGFIFRDVLGFCLFCLSKKPCLVPRHKKILILTNAGHSTFGSNKEGNYIQCRPEEQIRKKNLLVLLKVGC